MTSYPSSLSYNVTALCQLPVVELALQRHALACWPHEACSSGMRSTSVAGFATDVTGFANTRGIVAVRFNSPDFNSTCGCSAVCAWTNGQSKETCSALTLVPRTVEICTYPPRPMEISAAF